MPIYKITTFERYTATAYYEIEADSEEEALDAIDTESPMHTEDYEFEEVDEVLSIEVKSNDDNLPCS